MIISVGLFKIGLALQGLGIFWLLIQNLPRRVPTLEDAHNAVRKLDEPGPSVFSDEWKAQNEKWKQDRKEGYYDDIQEAKRERRVFWLSDGLAALSIIGGIICQFVSLS